MDLAEVALTLFASGVEDLAAFRWLESPDPKALARAVTLLEHLGALETAPHPTTRSTCGPALTSAAPSCNTRSTRATPACWKPPATPAAPRNSRCCSPFCKAARCSERPEPRHRPICRRLRILDLQPLLRAWDAARDAELRTRRLRAARRQRPRRPRSRPARAAVPRAPDDGIGRRLGDDPTPSPKPSPKSSSPAFPTKSRAAPARDRWPAKSSADAAAKSPKNRCCDRPRSSSPPKSAKSKAAMSRSCSAAAPRSRRSGWRTCFRMTTAASSRRCGTTRSGASCKRNMIGFRDLVLSTRQSGEPDPEKAAAIARGQGHDRRAEAHRLGPRSGPVDRPPQLPRQMDARAGTARPHRAGPRLCHRRNVPRRGQLQGDQGPLPVAEAALLARPGSRPP